VLARQKGGRKKKKAQESGGVKGGMGKATVKKKEIMMGEEESGSGLIGCQNRKNHCPKSPGSGLERNGEGRLHTFKCEMSRIALERAEMRKKGAA